MRFLIVAHEGTNAVILSHLLGIEPVSWASMRFSSAWTGISLVRTIPVADGHIWALAGFNRVSISRESSGAVGVTGPEPVPSRQSL